MARQLLTDDLWNAIKGFLPQQPLTPRNGRSPIDNCLHLTVLPFALDIGIAWADLPREMGCS